MLSCFKSDSDVLLKKPFKDYDVQFNLFYRISEGNEVLALKTEEDDLIAMCNPGHDMWIWAIQDMAEEKLDIVTNELCDVLNENSISGVSGEPDFISKISKVYEDKFNVECKKYIGMGAYKCTKVILDKYSKGKMVKANLNHTDIVSQYLSDFNESEGKEGIDRERKILEAMEIINNNDLFLWEVDKKIVAMARVVHKTLEYARITSVYTNKNERNNGYASSLVAKLSEKLLEEGLTPMLYANLNNKTAVNVYKNIGYEGCGDVDSVMFIY